MASYHAAAADAMREMMAVADAVAAADARAAAVAAPAGPTPPPPPPPPPRSIYGTCVPRQPPSPTSAPSPLIPRNPVLPRHPADIMSPSLSALLSQQVRPARGILSCMERVDNAQDKQAEAAAKVVRYKHEWDEAQALADGKKVRYGGARRAEGMAFASSASSIHPFLHPLFTAQGHQGAPAAGGARGAMQEEARQGRGGRYAG